MHLQCLRALEAVQQALGEGGDGELWGDGKVERALVHMRVCVCVCVCVFVVGGVSALRLSKL